MGFKEQFSQAKSTQEQQQMIYAAAISQGPPKDFYPITVNLPDGKKVTYETTKDYYSIGGVRAPMTAITAQALANAWGLVLPTAKMTNQIFMAARSGGGAIAPPPLSTTGYKDPNTGKQYSATEVVKTQIGAPSAAIAYNEKVDKEIKDNPNAAIYAGHGKTILQPGDDPNKLHFTGIEREVKKGPGAGAEVKNIQPTSAPHPADNHNEYITFARYIKNAVTVTDQNGNNKQMTVSEFLNDPNLYSALSDTKGMKTYDTSKYPGASEQSKSQMALAQGPQPAHHKHMSVDTPPSVTKPITDSKTMVDIAFNQVQLNYKKASFINPLRKLEAAIGYGLGKNIQGTILDEDDNLLTDFNDIERSVELCIGFLINQGKIKEAQAVLDALDVSIREEAPSATTFVVPKEMSEAEKYEPHLHQQIGRSQIDPPKFNHSKKCPNCNFIIENTYLLDSGQCPNCNKKI